MTTTTPLQALPVPQETDNPDVPVHMNALAVALEKRLFGVYNSASDRDAKITSPAEGQVAYQKDTDKVYLYINTWTQIWPATGVPAVFKGTTVPNNSTGVDGDLYFKY